MPVSSLIAGLGLGLSLIIAIGAQNLFVLRQGIRREHVFAVAAICALSDLALIVVGVSGVGAVLQAVPWLVEVIRWLGAAFLVGYGLLAARRAVRPSGAALVAEPAPAAPAVERVTDAASDAARDGRSPAASVTVAAAPRAVTAPSPESRTTLAAAVLTCLALTWLNPHVYLDTVFLLGSVGNTHGDGRWAFAVGAGIASIAWFFGLAYGARLLGGVLGSPRAWRVLDAVIAVVMIVLGMSLVLPR
ncbi:LysE/ArgO family amino acid transporter [Agromyces bauzanensis]|uniref:Transporter n=1 Tax=Agromyces bauzanensis TaxID=1308924 RepID=A0A917PLX1_9MICO|nr:LysE/ArgO family amino acid transporter [Agromyces bauzanensis]GGJ84016.1 transporter [Agromyces bauzanensis]